MVVVGCPAINNVRKCSLYNCMSSLHLHQFALNILAILSVQGLSIKLIIIYGLFLPFPEVHVSSIFSTFSFFVTNSIHLLKNQGN